MQMTTPPSPHSQTLTSHSFLPSLGMQRTLIENSSQEPYVSKNQPATIIQNGLTMQHCINRCRMLKSGITLITERCC